jgi:hypothetical protein
LSLTRRMRVCERLLNRLFPLTPANAIHWSHCVNLDTMSVEFTETCPLSQITGSATFADACRKVRMKPGDVIWQHAGLMRYNFRNELWTWHTDWERREINALNTALHTLFLEKRAMHPLPKNAAA